MIRKTLFFIILNIQTKNISKFVFANFSNSFFIMIFFLLSYSICSLEVIDRRQPNNAINQRRALKIKSNNGKIRSDALRDNCVAPLNPPSPFVPADTINENKYKLRLVQLVINHGSSAPSTAFLPHDQRGSWSCGSPEVFSHYESIFSSSNKDSYTAFDRSRRIRHTIDPRLSDFPPSCNPGDLLIQGFEEQYKLGLMYHNLYINTLHFLPDQYFDSTLLYVHATNSQNSIDSAISFMQGFYNPLNPNEILSIEKGGTTRDHFHPQSSTCQDLQKEDLEFKASDAFKTYANETNYKIRPLYDYLNISFKKDDFTRIDKMCDFLISGYCNENLFLPNETLFADVFDTCMQFNKFMLTNRFAFTQKGIAGSSVMRELNKMRNDFFSSNDRSDSGGYINGKRFQLISTHESAIVSLLLLFTGDKIGKDDVTGIYGPPPTSHLAFEVYENIESRELFMRVIYNGKEVKLFGEDKTFLTVHEITHRISPLIKYCNEFDI